MRFNPYNEISAALQPNDDEYPYNKLTPKDRKNSDQSPGGGRTDSLDLPGKKEVDQNPKVNNNVFADKKSESQSIISRNEYIAERRPSQNTQTTSAVALKNKSQPFYLRGYLKE